MKYVIIIVGLVILLVIGVHLYFAGTMYPLELAGTILFGWLNFLARVIPAMTLDFTSSAIGLLCAALLAIGVHRFCSWLYHYAQRRRAKTDDGDAVPAPLRPWRWRWTLAGLGVVVLIFVAGVAAVGVTHQAIWLATSPDSLIGPSETPTMRLEASNNLREVSLFALAYHDLHRKLPPGASLDNDGNALHSWATLILPFAGFIDTREIDMTLPWNHPNNAPVFKRVLYLYYQPGSDVVRNDDGYALSHYASNIRVMGGSKSVSLKEIKAANSTSNTLMIGQVADNHMPWGQPGNWREPALGINTSPHGFGNQARTGALFAFADGHVEFLSNKTSPDVLKAMSMSNGDD
jgi:prepilin-type processing-associated H-X9-DG protein